MRRSGIINGVQSSGELGPRTASWSTQILRIWGKEQEPAKETEQEQTVRQKGKPNKVRKKENLEKKVKKMYRGEGIDKQD